MTHDDEVAPHDRPGAPERLGAVSFERELLDGAAYRAAVVQIDVEPMTMPFMGPMNVTLPRIDRLEARMMLTVPAVADLLRRVEELERRVAELEA